METPSQPSLPGPDPAPEANPVRRKFGRFGLAGLVIAMVALVGALLSPWVIDLLSPPPQQRTIEEVAVDVAVQIRDRVAARARGEQYAAAAPQPPQGVNWNKVIPGSVIAVAALAMCLGVVSFVRQDDPRLASATVGVAVSAVLFQYFVLMAAVIIGIVLLAVILGALGVDLPSI